MQPVPVTVKLYMYGYGMLKQECARSFVSAGFYCTLLFTGGGDVGRARISRGQEATVLYQNSVSGREERTG